MADRDLPPIDLLRQLLAYDPETGALTWRERPVEMFKDGAYPAERECARWNSRYAGKPALAADNGAGYRVGAIFKVPIKAHRAAWAIHYGRWPELDLDHINGDGSDNRIANLREATQSQNQQNRAIDPSNKLGAPGVTFCKRDRRFRAQISTGNRRIHLGSFDTAEEAAAAYRAAKRELHPFAPEVRR